MSGMHLNLRGNRPSGPLTPEQRARWWIRTGTRSIDEAIRLLRARGYDDYRIKSEFGADILEARRRVLKERGYSDQEISQVIRSGNIFGKVDLISGLFVYAAILWKRRRLQSTEAAQDFSEYEAKMQDSQQQKLQSFATMSAPKFYARRSSKRTIKALLVAAGFLMLLFPPWTYTFTRPGSAVARTPAGYGFLFSPPEPQKEAPVFGVELDMKRLMLQLALLGGAFVVEAYTGRKPDA